MRRRDIELVLGVLLPFWCRYSRGFLASTQRTHAASHQRTRNKEVNWRELRTASTHTFKDSRILLSSAQCSRKMMRNNESGGNGDTWIKLGDIGTFATPWMTIVGENLLDDNGNELEYWRVQKDDSVVILTCQYEDDNQTTGKARLVFPKPMYRPGVGYSTLDFPGGRIPKGGRAMDVIPNILRRELQIDPDSDILSLEALNDQTEGWLVNSSFSNQKLFGFCAILRDNPSSVSSDTLTYDAEEGSTDLDELLSRDLSCLQCRMVLMEWLRRRANI